MDTIRRRTVRDGIVVERSSQIFLDWLARAYPLDAGAIISNLVLESAISIHYRGKKKDGNLITAFIFPDFSLLGQMQER